MMLLCHLAGVVDFDGAGEFDMDSVCCRRGEPLQISKASTGGLVYVADHGKRLPETEILAVCGVCEGVEAEDSGAISIEIWLFGDEWDDELIQHTLSSRKISVRKENTLDNFRPGTADVVVVGIAQSLRHVKVTEILNIMDDEGVNLEGFGFLFGRTFSTDIPVSCLGLSSKIGNRATSRIRMNDSSVLKLPTQSFMIPGIPIERLIAMPFMLFGLNSPITRGNQDILESITREGLMGMVSDGSEQLVPAGSLLSHIAYYLGKKSKYGA